MRSIRSRFTSAHLIALIALFVALGGSAYAFHLGKNSVKTKNIKNGAVTEAKIAGGAVTASKLAPGAIAPANLGDIVARHASKPVADGGNAIVSVFCAPTERLLSGFGTVSVSNAPDLSVHSISPSRSDGTAIPDGESVGMGGGIDANFLNATGGTSTASGTAYVLCLK